MEYFRVSGGSRAHLTMSDVRVYSIGLVHCSVCAPVTMGAAAVEAAVNAQNPTGIDSDWACSDDESFATGQPNPCPCEDAPQARRHWLMVC